MLIVVGGLPGTGKTTIAKELARQLRATFVRIDVIEQAIRQAGECGGKVGAAGYSVAYALAESNLDLGGTVIAECVNPILITRSAWRDVAVRKSTLLFEVEVSCSDVTEHRRRVESRVTDIAGLALPTWDAVMAREYEPWTKALIRVDTARMTPAEAVVAVLEAIRAQSSAGTAVI